jgi:hypothetical protein
MESVASLDEVESRLLDAMASASYTAEGQPMAPTPRSNDGQMIKAVVMGRGKSWDEADCDDIDDYEGHGHGVSQRTERRLRARLPMDRCHSK